MEVPIHTPFITLDQALKWAGLVETGGQAKTMIAAGETSVNGEKETRRGRKLYPSDVVAFTGTSFTIVRGEGK